MSMTNGEMPTRTQKKPPAMRKRSGVTTSKGHRNLLEPWRPGQSGNPAGRPKSSRHKINEHFLRDLQALWEKHGYDILEATAAKKPEVIVKAMVALLPKQVELAKPLEEMTDEQLAVIAEHLLAKYGRAVEAAPEASVDVAGEGSEPNAPLAT
jgi:hypothetical protein